jgi:hypothetical protein
MNFLGSPCRKPAGPFDDLMTVSTSVHNDTQEKT